MTEHRLLTGASLHEPKGVETATSGQVYVANGTGSGAWSNPFAGNNYLNKFVISGTIPDLSSANSNFIHVVPQDSTLGKIYTVLGGSTSGSNNVVTLYKNGIAQTPTITISSTGSGKGVTSSVIVNPAIIFNDGDTVELRTAGGSTGSTPLSVSLSFAATT